MELLLVIVIAGIALGMVSLSLRPGEARALQDDAARLAALMQLAGDEAILRDRSILLEADAQGYRFFVRAQDAWQPLNDDRLLRSRHFSQVVQLRLQPDGTGGAVRIVFEPQPVGRPFDLRLSAGDASADIHADGLGQYVVE